MIIAALVVFSSLLFDDKLVVTPGQPPDRGEFNAAICPPAITDASGNIKKTALPGGTKEQGGSPQDKDVDNDGKKDYFMGEWKFVKVDRDLTVQQWCISRGDDFSHSERETERNSRGVSVVVSGRIGDGLFMITFVVQAFAIPSSSMENTLLVGDHVFVNRIQLAPKTSWLGSLLPYHEVRGGDIAVFVAPNYGALCGEENYRCSGGPYPFV